jgi:hypothetical protein
MWPPVNVFVKNFINIFVNALRLKQTPWLEQLLFSDLSDCTRKLNRSVQLVETFRLAMATIAAWPWKMGDFSLSVALSQLLTGLKSNQISSKFIYNQIKVLFNQDWVEQRT